MSAVDAALSPRRCQHFLDFSPYLDVSLSQIYFSQLFKVTLICLQNTKSHNLQANVTTLRSLYGTRRPYVARLPSVVCDIDAHYSEG